MRQSRFSEEQIIGFCGSRRRGDDWEVPPARRQQHTFYRWQARYGGLGRPMRAG